MNRPRLGVAGFFYLLLYGSETPLYPGCISFLGLPYQRTTHWVACNNRNVLSHSLEVGSLGSRHQQGRAPSERLLPRLSLTSGGGQQSLVFPGLQVCHSSPCPCHHMIFSPVCLCVPVSSPLLIRISVILDLGPSLLWYNLTLLYLQRTYF